MRNKIFEKYFVFTPYFWLVLFFFIPLAIIFKISISVSEWGMPPYQDLFIFDNGFQFNATLENYFYILGDFYYYGSFLNSLFLALVSTMFCILIGFPISFYIATSEIKLRNILLILVVIPFWSSFLLRVYAWKIILQNNGFLNLLLIKLGIISEPLQLLYNQYAVVMGIVYTYLPLMILPLYGYLNKFDLNLIDASKDLGLNRIKTFFRVILPLSIPAFASIGILQFLWVWNDLLVALVFLDKMPSEIVLTSRLREMLGEFSQNWEILTTSAFVSMIVPLLVFLSLQRYFIRGLVAGSVKG